MTSPVTANPNIPANMQTQQENVTRTKYCAFLWVDPSLPEDQKALVRNINVLGLSLYAAGLALFGISLPLSDAELTDPDHMIITSLRFPCLIFGASVLCCANFANSYFKKTNEAEKTELQDKIKTQVEQKVRDRLV
jgi:hypothetical protein